MLCLRSELVTVQGGVNDRVYGTVTVRILFGVEIMLP
jgi:hypothetical protein